ncbi:hypothetical protein A9Q96_04565 [Rhodobacterales bacterium 52_120_T64]|nr:hypothetical protein A9Q96_04565 [Rhodobacterales bacterium 52_120_T64]
MKYEDDDTRMSFKWYREHHYQNVDDLLVNGPEKIILVGLPGAGKSFSVGFAASVLAKRLQEASLQENVDLSDIVIPLAVDMKQYGGSLWDLVEDTLPAGLTLKHLIENFKVKIFVDSFNEMPKKYWNDALYDDDLKRFLEAVGGASTVIASRTAHGMPAKDFKVYTLDSIDEEVAEAALLKGGFQQESMFRKEMVELVRRPFFYRLLQDGRIDVGSSPDPRSVFNRMFFEQNERFEKHFSQNVDITPILQQVAFTTLNAGTETFNTTELEAAILSSFDTFEITNIAAIDVVNWLVSEQTLQPLPKGKLAFFHQSVTEYLAATRLASRYENDPTTLREVLRFRRWDQAIMQTMSLLKKESAASFLETIVRVDQGLALSSCKYIEQDRDEIICNVLEKCIAKHEKSREFDFNLMRAIETDLPLNASHVPLLRRCVAMRDSIGGAAIKKLAEIQGVEMKSELLALLLEDDRDFNFLINGVSKALNKLITIEDLAAISNWVKENPVCNNDDEVTASAIAQALLPLPAEELVQSLVPDLDSGVAPALALDILCTIARDIKTQAWLDICFRLLPLSLDGASVAISFITNYSTTRSELSFEKVSEKNIETLVEGVFLGNIWSLSALLNICKNSGACSEFVKKLGEAESGLRLALLKYCENQLNVERVFESIQNVLDGKATFSTELPALKSVELDWSGKEELFLRIINSRDRALLRAVLKGGHPTEIETLGKLDFGDVLDILEWLKKTEETNNGDQTWFVFQIASLIGSHCDKGTKNLLLSELENEESPYRAMIAHKILVYCEELTIDQISERSISYLLSELRHQKMRPWNTFLISEIADQAFVEERLLPLAFDEDSTFQKNLAAVLEQVGRRHGRRYLV